MPIKLNGSTSGYVELKSPAVAGSTSLELPTDSIKPGLVLVNETAFSAAGSVSVNNCFSSIYANYKIILHTSAVSGTNQYVTLRWRTGGTDNTNANYNSQRLYQNSSTVGGQQNSSGNTAHFLFSSDSVAATEGGGTYDVINPFASYATLLLGKGYTVDAGGVRYQENVQGGFTATTSFDGFTLYPYTSGTISGTVRIYGYRNSL